MNYYEQLIAKEKTFTDELMKEFPSLFNKDDAGELVSPDCGISCPEGWQPLVKTLCAAIVSHCENKRYQKTRKIHKLFCFWAYRSLFVPIYNRVWRLVDPKSCYPKKNFWTVSQLNEIKSEHPIRTKLRNKLQKFNSSIIPNIYEEAPKVEVKVSQVKQKFSLRFYVDGADDYIYGMINFAEHLSLTICEETGESGSPCIRGGWMRTLSEEKMKSLGYSECQKTNQ